MTTVLDSPKPPHAADARTSTLGRRLRRVGRDLWETFFAGPVRENAIRARGGGMPGALAVVAGLLAFAVAALGVLFSGQLAARPIGTGSATLGSATTPGDPIGIPVLAYPALMSLLDHGALVRDEGWRILLVIGVSTLLVMIVTAFTVEAVCRWKLRHES